MPTSKKPRKKATTKPKRVLAVDQLMSRLSDATMDGDLDAFDSAYDELVALAARDPAIDAGIFDDLDQMRAEMVEMEVKQIEIDAALWAGDLERAERLEMALFGPDDMDDLDDEDEVQGALIDLTPDPYADLAAGKPGAVEALLAAGVDLNAHLGPDPRPALFAALEAPNRGPDTVKRLIAAGADPLAMVEGENATAMVWALLSTHMAGFDADSEGRLFDLLLQHGADPDEGCDDFGSVLNRAIVMGLPAHVAALLRAGAATDTSTPHDFAIYDLVHAPSLVLAAPKPDALALLLDAGADPLVSGSFDRTPLEFVNAAAADARARQSPDDPWTVAHAAALTRSAELLLDWANRRSALRN